jgi:malonate decarboxylase epsilon subunit
MPMRCAFLFPGQGSQTPEFLDELPDHEETRRTFSEVLETLGQDPREMDSAAGLGSTVNLQLSTLVAGVAYSRILAARDALPDAVAGLSVGAFSAAVTCGALAFDDALRLVRLRAESMTNLFGAGGYGMLALVGLRERVIQSLVERIASPTMPLFLSSVNSSAELVVAGSDSALSVAAEAAHELGASVRRLNVTVPSHGPLLNSVSDRLREAMRDVPLNTAHVPYIGNVRARALRDGAEIAEDLVLNVSRTVRWHESIELLRELGAHVFVEAPPGVTLSNLIRREFLDARAVAAVDVGIDSVIHAVRKATES